MTDWKHWMIAGAALALGACSNEAARNRPDLRNPDPFRASERLMNSGSLAEAMASQFTPGDSKYSDEDGPMVPEGYTPPDFEKIDLGGMGMGGAPSFGITPDGKVVRLPNQVQRVILPPGYGPQVIVGADGRIGVQVPTTSSNEGAEESKESGAKK